MNDNKVDIKKTNTDNCGTIPCYYAIFPQLGVLEWHKALQ